MKKNLIKPKIDDKPKKYKSLVGAKLTAMALAFGMGGLIYSSMFDEKIQQPTTSQITFAVVHDIADDDYKNSIPLYTDSDNSSVATQLRNGSLVFFTSLPNTSNQQSISACAINDFNNLSSGYISPDYIKSTTILDTSKYNSLYIVREERGINLRSSAEVTQDNKIGAVPNNSILIGATSENKTENKWTHVLYANGKSITEGYVSGEFLEKIGGITNRWKICRSNTNYRK